jgi:hypothetical protein
MHMGETAKGLTMSGGLNSIQLRHYLSQVLLRLRLILKYLKRKFSGAGVKGHKFRTQKKTFWESPHR